MFASPNVPTYATEPVIPAYADEPVPAFVLAGQVYVASATQDMRPARITVETT